MPGGQPLRMPTMNKGAASKFNLVAGGPKHAARSLRTAGAALPLGAVARGSPARMLHEMVGVEREVRTLFDAPSSLAQLAIMAAEWFLMSCAAVLVACSKCRISSNSSTRAMPWSTSNAGSCRSVSP